MLDIVIEARKASIGPGMDVRRILPFRLRRMVGPFIFMDHAGPVSLQPPPLHNMDVLPHPHIGLSTVSYLFDGQVTHRDSLGVEQIIRPGEVNWMTAGSGIAHSERFEDPATLAGSSLEMIQTWVALPEKQEEAAPSFDNYKPEQLPVFTDTGLWMRLIAGNAYGLTNGVQTHSPMFYLHVKLQKGARFGLPPEHSERGIYIAKGSLEIAGRTYSAGQMLVFTKGLDPAIFAKEDTTFMLLGGEPLGERYIWWNFVSSRKERIEQAKADWKAGRILLPPNDNLEFVPLNKSEKITWSGKHRPAIDNRGVYPRPYQKELPVWVAVGGTPASVVRAASKGLPMALAIIGGEPARFVPFTDLYKQTYKESGYDPATMQLAINSHGYIADDSKQAADEFYGPYAYLMSKIGRERGWSGMDREHYEQMRGAKGSLLVGSPQQVIDKILYNYELFGNTRFLLHISVGTLPHKQVLRAIELLGTIVAPAVKKAIGEKTRKPV